MYLGYAQVAATATVKTDSDFPEPPANATHVELQATEQNVLYTMDNATSPTAGATGTGMTLLTTQPPKTFLMEDFRRIRFIRGAGSDGKLNAHYFAGRDT